MRRGKNTEAEAWRERALALETELDKLRSGAVLEDPETHIGNTVRFERELDRLNASYVRTTAPFAVVIVEMNVLFRKGAHPSPEILALGGEVIAGEARTEDCVCDLGAGAFGILLAGSTDEGARQFVERLRNRLQATNFRMNNQTVFLDVAAGVASWQGDSKLLWQTIRKDMDRARSDLTLHLQDTWGESRNPED